MDEFTKELKECAAALHDGMGGHADYCARLMEEAADRINRMKSDHTAQSLALKAAKAMQQAETERADANEQDAKRYRTLLEEAWLQEAADRFDFEDGGRLDKFKECMGEMLDKIMEREQ